MSDNGFVIGLPSRVDEAAASRVRAQTREHQSPTGFTPAELIQRIEEAFGGSTAETVGAAPRHFHPADRADNPTEGWDPLDAAAEPSAFLDPVEVARAEGYEDGVAAATLAAREDMERDRAMMTALAAELKAGGAIDRAALADALRRTVLALVGKLVGENGVSGELLAARIAAASDLLADAHESAMLRVHPDDVALLDGLLPDTIFPVGDAAIARGSFVLEAASTIVEDGPALWLDQLAGAIERVPLPASRTAAA
ncbi:MULTISPECIES: FliH/SctL family protein [Sphingomonas]|jgi:flagellar assembly protein FliH|uniref:Flagellar biosynthesis protein FliH n=1 Tax=Sphingomonas ginsenosidimutans TaxID=862134 RepID=A0A2A4HYH2_9SPHN|nr:MULTISPECIES: FliH/SctL family protein [Sphingomonas]MBY0301998.1 flagellar assembly protein FliH [Sphingomonas ginsenosidimutans]PCG08959.1 flagellar biosynthesis protein FliH [Sphingomonas ginsenosidimutans]